MQPSPTFAFHLRYFLHYQRAYILLMWQLPWIPLSWLESWSALAVHLACSLRSRHASFLELVLAQSPHESESRLCVLPVSPLRASLVLGTFETANSCDGVFSSPAALLQHTFFW